MTQPGMPLGSPEWWLHQLHAALRRQATNFELMNAYYLGQPKRTPWMPEQAEEDLRRLISLTRSNYMGLVIDAMVERMQVEGFRVGRAESADRRLWDIWQANNMDSGSDQLLLESAIGGQSYALVAPNPNDLGRPFIYPEHPTQAIVAYEAGTARRQRAAGLKLWKDDWTGKTFATLYRPNAVFKWQSERPIVAGEVADVRWVRRQPTGEDWPGVTGLGVVPLVEVPNNPRLLGGGVSEIADVITIQDRINKTLADRMMAQDYGAFPQKWATGFPAEDEQGNPQRINVGRDRMVTSDMAETKFGQWEAAPLDPYSAGKREDVKDIASRTRTPAQYLLGEMSNVNGETLRASESGLVSKVRQRHRTSGEGLEEVARLARRMAGVGGGDEALETIWRNPEFRAEGELVDALVKMKTLGVPDEALWERYGASQVEIDRWKKQREEQIQLDPVGQLTRLTEQGEEVDQESVDDARPGN